MSQNIDIKNALELVAQKVRVVKKDVNGEWLFKCPFCGDSENPYHAHLYISAETGLMNCFRCEVKGSINRLLAYLYDTKFKAKIDTSSVNKMKRSHFDTGGIRRGITAFEDYMHDLQVMLEFNDTFNIPVSVSSFKDEFNEKNLYMEKRTIRDSSARDLLYKSNLMQKFYTYYSEYVMQKLYSDNAVPAKMIKYTDEYILNSRASILFLGVNKTLNIFKTESEASKYIKIKHNAFSGISSDRDFFVIVNMRKHNSINDVYRMERLNVYFAEGVYDAINLYLYNPSYATDVEPDLIVATGSKVSYPSAMFFIMDMFMKPVIPHCFLDPDINHSAFKEKFSRLRKFYDAAAYYKNGDGCDYGDVSVTSMKGIRCV
jgi:hypothetical protein